MEKLLDPKLRTKTSYNSRKFIEEKLSWRIIAKQFLKLLSNEIEARES